MAGSGEYRNAQPGTNEFFQQQYVQPVQRAWQSLSDGLKQSSLSGVATVTPRQNEAYRKYYGKDHPQWTEPAPQPENSSWLHKDLPGPSTNRVGKDYDPSTPGIQGDPKTWPSGNPPLLDQPPIDTTQAANTPIVTRSPDEAYTSYLQQHGIKDADVKAAADKGGKIGAEYRGQLDIMQETPAYIRPGSKEWQERDDMKIWLDKFGHTAMGKQVLERGRRNEARIKAHQERMGLKQEQDTAEANIGGTMYPIEESAIIDLQDQNPGLDRRGAVEMIQRGIPNAKAMDRQGATSRAVTNEDIDREMASEGMQRNQAIDMTRAEEPAFLPIGKSFTNPGANRIAANTTLQKAAHRQAQFTGTNSPRPNMQPQSGLNPLTTRKSPLKYEQGNIHSRADEDLQNNDDLISPDRFLYEVQKGLGTSFFGPAYKPNRPRPEY